MKKSLLVTCLIFLSVTLFSQAQIAPTDYVTTWKTDNPGTSGTNQIQIPASGQYTIYYESIPAGISGTLPATGTYTNTQTITLPAPGTYRIAIKPAGATPFHRINFSSIAEYEKLLTIEQWGSTVWSSMASAYAYCSKLTSIPAVDTPNLTKVTEMGSAFSLCTSLASAPMMKDWDVSRVTNMQGMFAAAAAFNEPIGSWNVSNVTDMNHMFTAATIFNQPIGTWDVSKVQLFFGMFAQATAFNQPIGNWTMSSAYSLNYMFNEAASFNQPLGNWNIAGAMDLTQMFDASGMDCGNYNATLIGWAANPATPSGLSLGAQGRSYGPPAIAARNTLTTTKGWTISGDAFDPACTSLPVTLVSFSAKPIGNSVELNWETSREIQNDHFRIERSKDLIVFETVAQIRDVAGNSTSFHAYRAIDQTPFPGTSYYRLLQVDLDGTTTVSRPVSVILRSQAYTLYPNPVRNQSFHISIDEPHTADIQLYNTSGKAIAFTRKPEDTQTVLLTPSQQLSPGNYLIMVKERATSRTFQVAVE